MTSNRCTWLFIAMTIAAGSLFGQAPMVIVVVDPPGIGFNDRTPAAPVGGNEGTTVGEQRLTAARYAAAIWSSKLESPTPIRVRSRFSPLPCDSKSSLLAAASPTQQFTFKDVNNEVIPYIWYPVALANRLTRTVLDPDTEEIVITFNLSYGQDCALDQGWYYGLDNRAPASQADMVATTLHELGHGLGFGIIDNDFTRHYERGDIFGEYLLDTRTGKTWNQMTNEERAASAANTHGVVWNGVNVRRDVPRVLLSGAPTLRIAEPRSLSGDYYVQTAEFGSRLAETGVGGDVVIPVDAANNEGPSTTDACSPILNASDVAGRIALVDRGTCTFLQKARNVQAAGALGLIVANNVEGTLLIRLTGADPEIHIPVVQITQANGNAIKASLASFEKVAVSLLADADRRAGADRLNRPMLYNATPAKSGATMSHWDPIASPNQLMEPDIEIDLMHTVEPPHDLTLSALRDLGWFADFDGVPDGVDQCPGSDPRPTLVIQGCDTHVSNAVFSTGCRVSDYFKPCDGKASDSAEFAACVAGVSRQLTEVRSIRPRESQSIQACVAPVQHP